MSTSSSATEVPPSTSNLAVIENNGGSGSHSSEKKHKKKEKVERTKLRFEVVQEGQYGRHPKEFRGSLLFKSADSVSLMEKIGVRREIYSQTDFDKYMLLYVCSGQKLTGGYSIELKRVFQRHNDAGDLEVYAEDKDRMSGTVATMALTLPFIVARVEKPNTDVQKNEFPVVWMDGKERKKSKKDKDRKKHKEERERKTETK